MFSPQKPVADTAGGSFPLYLHLHVPFKKATINKINCSSNHCPEEMVNTIGDCPDTQVSNVSVLLMFLPTDISVTQYLNPNMGIRGTTDSYLFAF